MRHERCIVRAGRPVTQLVTKLLDQKAESYTRSSRLSYTFIGCRKSISVSRIFHRLPGTCQQVMQCLKCIRLLVTLQAKDRKFIHFPVENPGC